MIKTGKKKKNKFAIIAGVTGAVVGVGAAVAGAFALKDKKNRDKVKKVLAETKTKAGDYIKKIKKTTPKTTKGKKAKK